MTRWRACSYPGCPELVTGSTRCPPHTVKADDKYRPNSNARGYDARWRKFRAGYISRHPNCSVLNCFRKSTDVDHIDNLGPRGPRGYDETNLMALCHQHHSSKTAATTHQQRHNGTTDMRRRRSSDDPQ